MSATKRALDKEQAASVLSSEVGDRLLVIAGSLLEVNSSSTRDCRDSGSGSEGERVAEKEKEVLDSSGAASDIECHTADTGTEAVSQSESESDNMLEKIKWLEERLKAESKLRISTSKKLLLLANVLSGRSNIGEFDSLNSP